MYEALNRLKSSAWEGEETSLDRPSDATCRGVRESSEGRAIFAVRLPSRGTSAAARFRFGVDVAVELELAFELAFNPETRRPAEAGSSTFSNRKRVIYYTFMPVSMTQADLR